MTAFCLLTLPASLISTLAAEGGQGAEAETRAYVLGGYIPKFYELPSLSDPFDETEFEEHESKLRKYEQGIISYLKQHGIEAGKIEFKPEFNALFLTDTPEKLAMHEIMLRDLFRPDMQLKAIDGVKNAFADRKILEGDRLSRVGFLDDLTFRSFHGEVRKLEGELESLPEDNQERKVIIERLKIAKEYRESAIKLYLKSLEEQKALIERWQQVTSKTEQGGAGQPATAPELKPEGSVTPKPESEAAPR